MKERYRKLLNRELDGLVSPEEEAELMDRVSHDPELASEHEAHHRIHRAFQAMTPALCPPDLGRRIADRVLRATPTVAFWRTPAFFRAAAALMLCTVLAGLLGYHVGQEQQTGELTAHSNVGALSLNTAELKAAWRSLGADDATISRVLAIDFKYDARPLGISETESRHLDDLYLRDKLKVLPAEVLARFIELQGISKTELQRLLAIPD